MNLESAKGITLTTLSAPPMDCVPVQKRITLCEDAPILAITYRFQNLKGRFTRFTFGIHPAFALGTTPQSLQEHRYCVPHEGPLEQCAFGSPGYKAFIPPLEGWCALFLGQRTAALFFPHDVIDVVEVYYRRIGTHLVLQPIIHRVGLSPNRYASFECWFYFGDGDVAFLRDLRHRYDAHLQAYYEVSPSTEILRTRM